MAATAVDICNMALGRLGQLQPITAIDGSDASPNGLQCKLFYPNIRDLLLERFPWSFATKSALLYDSTVLPPQTTIPGWQYEYFTLPADYIQAVRIFNGARGGQPLAPLLQNEFFGPDFGPGGAAMVPMINGTAPEVAFSVIGGADDGGVFTDYQESIPAYDSTVTYQPPQVVMQNGVAYQCTQSPGGPGHAPPNASFWAPQTYLRQIQLLYIFRAAEADFPPSFADALAWRLAVEIALSRPKPELALKLEQRAELAFQRAASSDLSGQQLDARPASPTIAVRG